MARVGWVKEGKGDTFPQSTGGTALPYQNSPKVAEAPFDSHGSRKMLFGNVFLFKQEFVTGPSKLVVPPQRIVGLTDVDRLARSRFACPELGQTSGSKKFPTPKAYSQFLPG